MGAPDIHWRNKSSIVLPNLTSVAEVRCLGDDRGATIQFSSTGGELSRRTIDDMHACTCKIHPKTRMHFKSENRSLESWMARLEAERGIMRGFNCTWRVNELIRASWIWLSACTCIESWRNSAIHPVCLDLICASRPHRQGGSLRAHTSCQWTGRTEPTADYRRIGWVWETTRWSSSRLQKIKYRSFYRNLWNIYTPGINREEPKDQNT